MRTCLFSKEDRDLRELLRANATDEEIVEWVKAMVMEKEEGHRINEPGFVPPSRTMVFIGDSRRGSSRCDSSDGQGAGKSDEKATEFI